MLLFIKAVIAVGFACCAAEIQRHSYLPWAVFPRDLWKGVHWQLLAGAISFIEALLSALWFLIVEKQAVVLVSGHIADAALRGLTPLLFLS